MKIQGDDFRFYFNNESKTREEIEQLIDYNTTVSIKGFNAFYSSPKTYKVQELLKEADEHQKQNGGILKGAEFPFESLQNSPNKKWYAIQNGTDLERKLAEQKIIEELNINEFYNALPSQENLDKMSDSFLERVKNNSDKCGIVGKKESKVVEKAPIFTYCKQMKNAIEALSLRSLYGHNKYEKGNDWENFSRVENGEFEYSNAAFRHALGIGEEDEKEHLIAEAWNSVTKLEIYLRKNLAVSK